MTQKTVTLHIYACTAPYDAPGDTVVISMDYRGVDACMKYKVWLGQAEVEVDFPEIDLASAQVEALEAEIQKERADSQVRVNLLLDRISKLQAIGHEQ